jgi:hypothetical protein
MNSQNSDNEVAPMHIPSDTITMQEPTEGAEASIPTENVGDEDGDDPNLNGTFAVRRKAAKRTLPWNLEAEELELVPPSHAEATPATKRPRLEEPFSATTDVAATNISSHDTAVSLPAPDADHADSDPVKGTLATAQWRPEEDAKLNSALTNACKKKFGKEYKTDWAAIAALVPGRTNDQCKNRWQDALDSRIDWANGRTGKWTALEDSKLKDAVQTHGAKNWKEIAVLVPGRTKSQCFHRWWDVLDPSIDRSNGRAGKWTSDDDSILKESVKLHNGKDWVGIAALVPGRTSSQCFHRWKLILDPTIDWANGIMGKWSEDEDIKLKDAVQTYGGKNWGAIAAFVSGRTNSQCKNRWHNVLHPTIDRANERMGKWSEDEDRKLKDAVQMHGGKNWGAIAALVPGRTPKQCHSKWNGILHPTIDRANGITGKWSEDEDIKLKDSVRRHGGKNWGAISALVAGRTKQQCCHRWHNFLDPSIGRECGRSSNWTEDEDAKLKDSVQMHGGKNWEAIAALVPGRTLVQCSSRWRKAVDSIDRANRRTGKWTEDEDAKLKDSVRTHGGKNWCAIAALVPGRTKAQCWDRCKTYDP